MPVKRLHTLRGSTMIEVVVGFFLISLAVGLTTVLFNQVMNSSVLYSRHRAYLAVNNLVEKQQEQNTYEAVSEEYGDLVIEVTLTPFGEKKKLYIVTYQAIQKEKKEVLYKRQLLKQIKPNDHETTE
ncbi:hypothetical protein [Prolixibacter sp. NT017]|uniref:type IV pilus modification PilV family protein n=1 Tax=Prolixibacter sp. NT017 TaxID=2652390 RepID=UPI001287BCFE|nr:hypothetical protein [Prolixibacter sp. NT017]GET24706.1 hypothetical protein NT017_10350 [Prolixibacter sp. NT017]